MPSSRISLPPERFVATRTASVFSREPILFRRRDLRVAEIVVAVPPERLTVTRTADVFSFRGPILFAGGTSAS